jgi:hypothetical protein
MTIVAGNHTGGVIDFYTGASALRGRMHPSGGFTWGGSTDPGVNNFKVTGMMYAQWGSFESNDTAGYNYFRIVNTESTYFYQFGPSYPAGADAMAGGHTIRSNGPGGLTLSAQHASGPIRFANQAIERGRIHPSGGFSWGSAADPGPGVFAPLILKVQRYYESTSFPTVVGGVITLDFSLATYFVPILTSSATISFINVPAAGPALWITILFYHETAGAHTITWPGGIRWQGGVPPLLSTQAGQFDMVTLTSYNGVAGPWIGTYAFREAG